ncbi:sensor histidine kinase [Rasiella sp. SM2506]|uniref:sensor histidine kinase n=1 Tax=Rasiella sp. SM2506 TaxID=3423914 RepID=UPI003D7BE7CE
MLQKEEITLIIYVLVILLFVCAFTVLFVLFFLKRKNILLLKQLEEKQRFERELAQSQIEIKEHTLKNISWELHDNVGQLLSVANIHLNMLQNLVPKEGKDRFVETKQVIAQAIQEIRSISKTLNNDIILKNGLAASIQIELERFNRLNFLKGVFKLQGTLKELDGSNEIIIFRMVQEFFSNVIKHAKAETLEVVLQYNAEDLYIKLQDNGVGFCTQTTPSNSGMETMKSRAVLIGATYTLTSQPGVGTTLEVTYPYKINAATSV